MSHFNLKSLAFYGTMIGSVLILFKLVTVYGESNLKAPQNLAGDYPLKSTTMPDCLKGQTLNLMLEQSGRYFAGELTLAAIAPTTTSIAPPPETKIKPEIIKLNGLLTDSPLTLTSGPARLGSCLSEEGPITVQIQNPEKILDKTKAKSLGGELRWSSGAIAFTAEATKPLAH